MDTLVGPSPRAASTGPGRSRDHGPVPTPKTAAEISYDAIRAAIIDGTHREGTMLSENELALTIGVSRTPIRSALTRLQDEGWLSIYPKRGALVLGLSASDIAHLADARLILESMGVQRATTAARLELADRLEPQVAAQRAVLKSQDIGAFVELTTKFHRTFVEAGENPFLIELGDRLTDRQRLLLFTQKEQLFERTDQIIQEHTGLIAHLRNDDPQGFSEALRTHLIDTHGPEIGPM
ncbi:GntR family transcriptional regulator [Nakamurella silvestris]|nr:GntR family transcriptional regulator [Nakamurella silvestris]